MKDEFVRSMIEFGFPPILAEGIGYFENGIRRLGRVEKKILNESDVVTDLLPSEILYCLMPRERRLVQIEATTTGQTHFDETQIGLSLLEALSNFEFSNQPLNININNHSRTFDLRVPSEKIIVAVIANKGISYYTEQGKVTNVNMNQVQGVVMGRINGLIPREYLRLFPGAYAFVSNTGNGLQMEFDHLVGDGCLIGSIFQHILATSNTTATSETIFNNSNRVPNHIPLEALLSKQKISTVMQAIGQTTQKKMLITAIKAHGAEPDETRRIIPVPIDAKEIASNYDLAKQIFADRTQEMVDTDLGIIVSRLGIGKHTTRRLKDVGYTVASLMYHTLIPFETLVAIWPTAVTLNSIYPQNENIAEIIQRINVGINMFPRSWGITNIVRPKIYLPQGKTFTDYSASGAATKRMESLINRLMMNLEQ